jgi:hypothetical protein
MAGVGEGTVDYSSHHRVLELASCVQLSEDRRYTAASEFCKLSGLLCSYGLYQVVCHDQLVLYCRGNTASFSARVMATDNTGKLGVSSWCVVGGGESEWRSILERLLRDMTPQTTSL